MLCYSSVTIVINMEINDYKKIKTIHTLSLQYDIPTERISTFWKNLEKNKVSTTQCKICKTKYFPPQIDCHKCLESNMKWVKLDTEGVLETYTHVMMPPTSFIKKIPYTVGVGSIKDEIKILAWIIDVPYNEIDVGMKMKMIIKEIDNRLIYMWTKAKTNR